MITSLMVIQSDQAVAGAVSQTKDASYTVCIKHNCQHLMECDTGHIRGFEWGQLLYHKNTQQMWHADVTVA